MGKKKAAPKPQPAPKPAPKPQPRPAAKPKQAQRKRSAKPRIAKSGNPRHATTNSKFKKKVTKKKRGLRSHLQGETGDKKRRKKRIHGKYKQGGKRKKRAGNTKRSIADRAYEKYLKKMYIPEDSIISTYDMSNVVRERFKKTVRFETEMPAIATKVRVSAQGIDGSSANDISIERFVPGSFSARLIVQNNGSKDVYLNRDGQALFNINGSVLQNEEHTVSVTLPSKEMRGGESAIDVGGYWVQSREQAESLGQWVLTNQGDGGEAYSMEVFGNPLLDIGDIIIIEYADKGLDDSMRFIITSLNHSFSKGFGTQVSVRKIWPPAGKSFVHKTGVPQNPILL
jgi:hypothetical protein